MPASAPPLAPELLELGWLELLGHTLHYGVVLAGLVGVVLLLAPGVLHARRRPGRRRADRDTTSARAPR